jgi:hypothetical protein
VVAMKFSMKKMAAFLVLNICSRDSVMEMQFSINNQNGGLYDDVIMAAGILWRLCSYSTSTVGKWRIL